MVGKLPARSGVGTDLLPEYQGEWSGSCEHGTFLGGEGSRGKGLSFFFPSSDKKNFIVLGSTVCKMTVT